MGESGLLKRMVKTVLNGPGVRNRVGRQARLDVLAIMANCALTTDPVRKAAVQDALMDVTEWFDEYMAEEGNEMDTNTEETPEPELHKAMLVLLCQSLRLQAQDRGFARIVSRPPQISIGDGHGSVGGRRKHWPLV